MIYPIKRIIDRENSFKIFVIQAVVKIRNVRVIFIAVYQKVIEKNQKTKQIFHIFIDTDFDFNNSFNFLGRILGKFFRKIFIWVNSNYEAFEVELLGTENRVRTIIIGVVVLVRLNS